METLQEAARLITSKSAKRAVVNSILLAGSALTLLFFASIASALFFQNFVPHQVLSVPVYLQYGSGINPYGVVSLKSPSLKSAQDYDISVALSMPQSPPNMERGNFMVSLHLLDQDVTPQLLDSARAFSDQHDEFEGSNVLFTSRRPTLIPYEDPVVSLASRTLFLFYHMLFPSSRTCEMEVPLAERISFSKSAAVPSSAYIEVEAGQTLQTYGVSLVLTARLRGLRWLMHHWRLPMYIAFTFLFWSLEVIFMGVAWSFLLSGSSSPLETQYEGSGRGGKTRLLKQSDEEDDFSDHPHNFPTYGRQPPLKHEPEVKDEEVPERPLSELPIGGAEADDEDEEEYERRQYIDSGIGTSYSEEGAAQMRRRASGRL